MLSLSISLLGAFEATLDQVSLAPFRTKSVQALLIYLVCEAQRPHTREALMELLWPGMPPVSAQANLRQTLYRLRKAIPEITGKHGESVSFLVANRQTIQIHPEADFYLDAEVFLRSDPAQAIALYRGDFLADFYLPESDMFEAWAASRRADYQRRVLELLETETAAQLQGANYEKAVQLARQQLDIDNLRESSHRQLMQALALSGQRGAALAQYETCRQLLTDELGVAPDAATVQLVEQIKTGEWSKIPGVTNEVGKITPPHNLPQQLTSFIGREAELAKLQELLAQPEVRLLTIVGPGGMGKTRLGLALAERELFKREDGEVHAYKHGVYFASLARLETADLLLPAIAEAINFRFMEGEDQREQLLRYLSNKAILLVLDNFEQLLAGSDLLDEILQRAPQTKLLITSRVRLNRQSEQVFPVGGMAYPSMIENSSIDMNEFSAIQLFVHCARRVLPDFALTADTQPYVLKICQMLQGMPLGIVLSASWLESLSLRAISQEMEQNLDFLATEMGDVPERQRSLRAAFNHSWQLLNPQEQAIFSQMSIFRGGFRREAGQAITGATLRDFQALVNKSLLTLASDARYEVHELLRQFAAEKLGEDMVEETGVRERHSIFYCALLEKHTPNWHNTHQVDTLSEVTREADNIQVAWDWALRHAVWGRLQEAIDSWGWYHVWRGLRENGERFCLDICSSLEQWSTKKPANVAEGYVLWAKGMTWYGVFATSLGTAAQRIQQGLTILAQPALGKVDTRASEAFALYQLGKYLTDNDREVAQVSLEKSLLLYEMLQDSWGTAGSLSGLSSLDWRFGDYDLAQQHMQASLAIYQEQGDRWDEAGLIVEMAWLYQNMGRLGEAEQLWYRAMGLFQELNYQYRYLDTMASIASGKLWQGRFEECLPLAQKSLAGCQEMGYIDTEGFVYLVIGTLHMFTGNYEQAGQVLTGAEALHHTVENYSKEAFVHGALGFVALGKGKLDEAQTELEKSLYMYQKVRGDPYYFLPLSGLGLLACYRGELDQSHHYFLELLTDGLKRKDFLWLLTALPGLALFSLKLGKKERAFMIWAQALHYPHIANSQYYEDIVGQVMRRELKDLPGEIVETTGTRAREMDIWQVGEMLLAELVDMGQDDT